MARRLCRRRKRSCTGLAPAYSSCGGNERENWVAGAAWRGLCSPQLKTRQDSALC